MGYECMDVLKRCRLKVVYRRVLMLFTPPYLQPHLRHVKAVACQQLSLREMHRIVIQPSSSIDPCLLIHPQQQGQIARPTRPSAMFSRLTKPASSNKDNNPTSAQPPSTPKTKTTSTHAHSKSQSQSTQHAISSPSKIPVATNPTSRSALNPDSERSNYLSFLFSQSQQGQATTPVKVNPKVQQSSVPQVYGHHDRYHNPYETDQNRYIQPQPSSDDVHMQTMKNTVNPAMLKQLAQIPPAPPARREREEAIRPGRLPPSSEDVHMRTVKHEPVIEKPKGLEEWEKRLVETADNKRKATVAQLCE